MWEPALRAIPGHEIATVASLLRNDRFRNGLIARRLQADVAISHGARGVESATVRQ
jgi:hypothetical protein